MNILLTGGTGYIGSHTALVLVNEGYDVVLYDNLTNSKQAVQSLIKTITGKTLPLIKGDVSDTKKLQKTLVDYNIEAVFHFAGLKAVEESVEKPIDYYHNNVVGSVSLLKAMHITNIKTLVFSSSATVYGDPQYLPLDEEHPTSAKSPYARSKLQIEEILADVVKSDPDWHIACLRYFNPVGAHDSGLIGEDPNNTPNNLMPYISKVAIGSLPHLNIFGNDFSTHDGTGVRDYIHVMDVAKGHMSALNYLKNNKGWHSINLGTGIGFSVLEILNAFEVTSNKVIPYQIKERRVGDIAMSFANIEKAKKQLNWQAKRTLNEMCSSAWKFQLQASPTHSMITKNVLRKR